MYSQFVADFAGPEGTNRDRKHGQHPDHQQTKGQWRGFRGIQAHSHFIPGILRGSKETKGTAFLVYFMSFSSLVLTMWNNKRVEVKLNIHFCNIYRPQINLTISPDTHHDVTVAGVVEECQGEVIMGFILTEGVERALCILLHYEGASTTKTLEVISSLPFSIGRYISQGLLAMVWMKTQVMKVRTCSTTHLSKINHCEDQSLSNSSDMGQLRFSSVSFPDMSAR